MKEIYLNKGYKVIVDDEDFDYLNQFRWTALVMPNSDRVYAVRTERDEQYQTKNFRMHRVIMNINDRHIHVDHINHNTLDNRKFNLRICTPQENSMNARKWNKVKTSSKYKGVRFRKDSKKYEARIRFNNKLIILGSFKDELDAAKAYNKKSIELFGEFAVLNKLGENR